jgi:hypothetical protein
MVPIQSQRNFMMARPLAGRSTEPGWSKTRAKSRRFESRLIAREAARVHPGESAARLRQRDRGTPGPRLAEGAL